MTKPEEEQEKRKLNDGLYIVRSKRHGHITLACVKNGEWFAYIAMQPVSYECGLKPEEDLFDVITQLV